MTNNRLSHAEIEHRMAQAVQRTRQKFIEDLMPKIGEIETLQGLMQDQSKRKDALDRLAFVAHRFSGIAATVGFEDIGDCAAEVEHHIVGLKKTSTLLSTLSDSIEALLDVMEDAVVEAL